MKYFYTLLLSFLFLTTMNAQVSCTDCPNGFFENGILTSQIDVINTGEDDISLNPLISVCVTIQHNWLGDVALSLESPDGLNYMLMGDEDNQWGGCQSGAVANVDVCFVVGDDNPLTPGVPYELLCNGSNACLEGDFTVTCGGQAVSPDGLAIPAPTCNILDYSSFAGNTVSGLWTLRFYCVCPDLEFGGFLEDWSMFFQDGSSLSTGDNNACDAFAGLETSESFIQVCSNNNDALVFDAVSSGNLEIPTENGFHYGSIAVHNNTIVDFSPTNEMETQDWEIDYHILKGVSYHEDAADLIESFVGGSLDQLLALQGTEPGGQCFRVSDFDMFIEVTVPTEMIELYTLCEGSTLDIYGTLITDTGDYVFETDINETCDAIVYVEVLEDDATSFERIYPIVCEGGIVEMTAENGMAFLWSGPNGFTSTEQTVVLNNADINASGTYTCEVTSFEGCTGNQVTELSLRCETRPIEIELGQSEVITFDQLVGDVDECQGAIENVAEVDFTASSIIITGHNEGEEEICFQAYENGLLKNITYTVNVGTPNSVIDPDVNLSIRPNPASDFVQINADGVNFEEVQFFDTKGALVKRKIINNSNSNVIIEDVILGLYIVKVKTAKGVLTRKLVIQ